MLGDSYETLGQDGESVILELGHVGRQLRNTKVRRETHFFWNWVMLGGICETLGHEGDPVALELGHIDMHQRNLGAKFVSGHVMESSMVFWVLMGWINYVGCLLENLWHCRNVLSPSSYIESTVFKDIPREGVNQINKHTPSVTKVNGG